jgi:hypothetical protein
MGDRVTLLPLSVVSCSQRSVLGTNHLPPRHIQGTVFTASFLIHRIIFYKPIAALLVVLCVCDRTYWAASSDGYSKAGYLNATIGPYYKTKSCE